MSRRFASPDEAESAFYEAFQRADLEAMMEVWAEDEEVACIHPGGERLDGLEEVRESWRRLFSRGPSLRFRITHRRVWRGALMAVHTVHENIQVAGERSGRVIATNVYALTAGGWRLVLHHASPGSEEAPPEGEPGAITLH